VKLSKRVIAWTAMFALVIAPQALEPLPASANTATIADAYPNADSDFDSKSNPDAVTFANP
jgi:tetrahydromethanopterin S-methyltransferase subunit E